jgi:hypothetical protein
VIIILFVMSCLANNIFSISGKEPLSHVTRKLYQQVRKLSASVLLFACDS